jgi:hypothetical protein
MGTSAPSAAHGHRERLYLEHHHLKRHYPPVKKKDGNKTVDAFVANIRQDLIGMHAISIA